MTQKLGNNYRLFIDSATPGTFAEIKGQQDLSRNGSSSLIDTSTKDSGSYATQIPGQKTLTIDCSIIPDLPDATGYTRLETVATASTVAPVVFQVRKSPYAVGDTVFVASMYVGNFNVTYGKDDAVKATFQLALAAAPTVDALT